MSQQLLPFLAVTGLVMAVPGPSVLFAVTHRVQGGPAAGLSAVLGLESGLALHVVAAGLGVSAAVAASPVLFTVLKTVGAGYLVVIGLQQLRSSPLSDRGRSDRGRSDRGSAAVVTARLRLSRIYRTGVLVDLLNPKTVLYFAALLPQFLQPGAVMQQTLLLGGCVVGLAFLFDGGYAALAGRIRAKAMPARAGRWARSASGCCFLTLAAFTLVG